MLKLNIIIFLSDCKGVSHVMANQKKNNFLLYFNNLTEHNQSYTYRWCCGDTCVHRHMDFYEIILITSGVFTHYYNHEVSDLEEGSLLIFDINQKHRLSTPPNNATHFTALFEPSYFQLLMHQFSFNIKTIEEKGFIAVKLSDVNFQYMRALANSITNDKHESNNVKLFFHNAMTLLTQTDSNTLSNAGDVVNDIIEKIRNYTYLTSPIQEIYAQYPYSAATIIKRFKEQTGTTINRFQTEMRLDFAARLLRETNQSIEQIAVTLGFLSSSHFFEHFKKQYGVTPSTYRKNNSYVNQMRE